jgi:predicted Zn-ribbon and HTH transcriptional regulator
MSDKGVFIGAYIPSDLKQSLRDRATWGNRTLAQEITHILTVVVRERLLLPNVEGVTCKRCEHVWTPRKQDSPPKRCPQCKSPYWDKERGELRTGRPPIARK